MTADYRSALVSGATDMPRRKSKPKQWQADELIRICQLYYMEGLTQEEIAARIHRNRNYVIQALKEARKRGLVHVWIEPPTDYPELQELASNLKNQFSHLKEVRLVLGHHSILDEKNINEDIRDSILSAIAAESAGYVDTTLKRADAVVAVGRGAFVRRVVNHIRLTHLHNKDLIVLPMIGFMGRQPARTDSNEIAHDLAVLYGGTYYWLVSPGFVRDNETKDAIVGHTLIRRTLQKMNQTNVALVTIGAFPSEGMKWLVDHGFIEKEEIQTVQVHGAVGEINACPFDSEGKPVRLPLVPIGLTLADIWKIGNEGRGTVIGIVGADSRRFDAAVAALKGKLVNVLVTDHVTASEILRRANRPPTNSAQREANAKAPVI